MMTRNQSIRKLPILFRVLACAITLFFVCPAAVRAQRVVQNGMELSVFDHRELSFDYYVSDFTIESTGEDYLQLTSPATNGYSRDAGQPMLPLLLQLVELPTDGKATVTVEEADWERLSLPKSSARLMPAPGARPKSMPPLPSSCDSKRYATDSFYALPLVQLTPLGRMGTTRLARLTLSPFRYNPVRRELEVCRHCHVTIRFKGDVTPSADAAGQGTLLKNLSLLRPLRPKSYQNSLVTTQQIPVYMVVAPKAFEETLQPLLRWKQQEGYEVETHYISNESREAILEFLQQRYDNATPLHPAPLMLLLVGDIDEIPVWMALYNIPGLEFHRTDLYYAEYTGDYLPDVLMGRLSVSDTAQLRAVVEKTLAYERFELADSSYLSRSLLVAGKEDTPPAPTVTNGQIHYLKQYLMEHDPVHDTFCYYNPASDTLGDSIRKRLYEGMGLVSYSAHCNINGWRYPLLRNSDIDTLTGQGHYFLAINNCCRTNEIIGNCFGEHLLRKSDGGAIGAIGASNETLWDEDYYWSVGYGAEPTTQPLYHDGQLGAYDRLFHTHEESLSQQAPCQSQIVTAGNWAVTQSGSPYDAFYWEIYSLLGDPSLMPYIGIPDEQTLEVDSIFAGDNQITVHGHPGARVAATQGDTLVGACIIDSTGNGTIACRYALLDSLSVTATAQFHRPLHASLGIFPYDGARLVVFRTLLQNAAGDTLDRLTLGDSTLLCLTLRNAGLDTASQHWLRLLPSEGDGDSMLVTVDQLAPQGDTTVNLWLYPQTERNPNLVTLHCKTGKGEDYWSQQFLFDLLVTDSSQHSDTTESIRIATKLHPTVFPNPASNRITLSGFEAVTQIILYDLMGRQICHLKALPDETLTYSTATLPNGIYSLRFIYELPDGNVKQHIKRLLINR